ncbi:hypothetical protein LDENG_00285650, partial [Lucifuga dentata]
VSCEELTPVRNEEVTLEGSTVTLSYKYSRAAALNDYFLWYRQYPGEAPEFLVSHLASGTTGTTTNSRLTPRINEKKTQMGLELPSLAASDSAVYYCAVRPTVTAKP